MILNYYFPDEEGDLPVPLRVHSTRDIASSPRRGELPARVGFPCWEVGFETGSWRGVARKRNVMFEEPLCRRGRTLELLQPGKTVSTRRGSYSTRSHSTGSRHRSAFRRDRGEQGLLEGGQRSS